MVPRPNPDPRGKEGDKLVVENTLFLMTQGAYAHMDHETVVVEHDGAVVIRVPLHHLGGIVAFGNVLLSPFLIHRFALEGKSIGWLSEHGAFRAQVTGPTSGNVLLRVAQQDALRSRSELLAKQIVGGKLHNQRSTLMRAAREVVGEEAKGNLERAARMISLLAKALSKTNKLNSIRGIEGMAARIYFRHLPLLIRKNPEIWRLKGRTRRPPRDPVNALLSFGYALLRVECQSAVEVAGLDPQVGFLHALRPGRPALALDLMEEFRSHVVDRLVLSLVNRGQIAPRDFEVQTGGAVLLTEKGRKAFLAAYQKRKLETIRHPVIQQSVPYGVLPLVQARIMARVLREEGKVYQPFVFR